MPSFYSCIGCGKRKEGYKVSRCKICVIKFRTKRKGTTEAERMAWFRHKKYGLEKSEFPDWFMIAHGKCAICSKDLSLNSKKNKACLDHDHKTGKIRGILCHLCNAGLGFFKDNPAILKKAMEWVS